jgi:protein-S-isoprenylcysteine O-methyltransferase Ste14
VDDSERRARERAEAILGLISLIVWLVLAFTLAIAFGATDEDHPQPIMMGGGIALVVAALPWLGYRWLVRRLRSAGHE